MELEDVIIDLYLRIDGIYREIVEGGRLRQRGFDPALSDAELLTIEIFGEIQGYNGDRAIWRYSRTHWQHYFPRLGSYKCFAKHCANLCWIKEAILQRIFSGRDEDIHIIDGVPMPVCHNARAYRARMLSEASAWGYCAAKDEHYYGIRGHVVLGLNGLISAVIISPANRDERSSLHHLKGWIKGMLIGDKGFISEDLRKEMADCGIDLQTPKRANMHDERPKQTVQRLMHVRKRVETTIGSLLEHFQLAKIKAHDQWHFLSKLYRKILAYNFSVMMKS